MGGNIFKTGKRLNKQEFNTLIVKVESFFEQLKQEGKLPNDFESKVIPYYRNKVDFGDLDILIKGTRHSKVLIDFLTENNIPFVKNSNIISFLYDNFQTDLIFTKEKYYQSSINYFSYNDFGNLVGRPLHKIGVKYGHKGLSLVIREKEYVLGEIELTTDINTILEIAGLNPVPFHKGFDDLEDIFEYVITSKWFNPDIFLLENRNHYSRTRDKKRKTYHEFLEYIRNNNIKANFNYPTVENKGGYNIREPYYTDIVLKYFPWVEKKVNALFEKRLKQKEFKLKYPPYELMKETGLKGKELGNFYTYLRSIDWLNNNDSVKVLLENYKKQLNE